MFVTFPAIIVDFEPRFDETWLFSEKYKLPWISINIFVVLIIQIRQYPKLVIHSFEFYSKWDKGKVDADKVYALFYWTIDVYDYKEEGILK